MTHYLYVGLDFGPLIMERLMDKLPAEKLDLPTYPGRFSPREIIAHMADWEPILLGRMKSCLSNPGGSIQGIDEGEMAEQNGYATSNVADQMKKFRAARGETIEWLNGIQPEDWQKFGVHTERGKQTVYDQASALLGHDLYHIEQLTAL